MIIKKKLFDKVNHIRHGDYNGVRFYHVECGSADLDRFLLSKTLSSYIRPNQIKILEMKTTLISELKHMLSQHYLKQPKQKIEWSPIKILNKNLKLIVDLLILPLPLVKEIEDK